MTRQGRTLRVLVFGADRPGVTASLFAVIEEHGAAGAAIEVSDVEQIVLRGRLVLGVLLTAPPGWDDTLLRIAVTRLLRLDSPPRPADSADALALAICHVWRGGTLSNIAAAKARAAALAGRSPNGARAAGPGRGAA